jgi:DNA-binding NtrC family response regulator
MVTRVGGTSRFPVDFRLVAATNRELEDWVHEGRFRQDLYYRLKVVTLSIPPLRRRLEDIPLFIQHFLNHFNDELGRSVSGVHPAVLTALRRHSWPGNVRELRNLVESLVLFSTASEITLEDLPAEYRVPSASPQQIGDDGWQPRPIAEIEKEAILQTLDFTNGHRGRAASLLGIGLRTLQRKLKEYGEVKSREAQEDDE